MWMRPGQAHAGTTCMHTPAIALNPQPCTSCRLKVKREKWCRHGGGDATRIGWEDEEEEEEKKKKKRKKERTHAFPPDWLKRHVPRQVRVAVLKGPEALSNDTTPLLPKRQNKHKPHALRACLLVAGQGTLRRCSPGKTLSSAFHICTNVRVHTQPSGSLDPALCVPSLPFVLPLPPSVLSLFTSFLLPFYLHSVFALSFTLRLAVKTPV